MNDEFTSDFSYSKLTLHVKMNASSTCLGMSGCLEPWSSTRPRTNRVSLSSLCFMCMISTMCRSTGSSGFAMQHTASTTMAVSLSASSSRSFERSAVFATHVSSSLSGFSMPAHAILYVSRNDTAAVLAASKPSTSTRGCSPSFKYRSACFRSSPMINTVEDVPSPVMSSCATAVRAIITAVGFWICISFRSTLPSCAFFFFFFFENESTVRRRPARTCAERAKRRR